MRKLTASTPMRYAETCAEIQHRRLVIGVGAFALHIGQKGRRRSGYYWVPIDAVYQLGAKFAAAETRDKTGKRKRRCA
jgi:hypothetical protein